MGPAWPLAWRGAWRGAWPWAVARPRVVGTVVICVYVMTRDNNQHVQYNCICAFFFEDACGVLLFGVFPAGLASGLRSGLGRFRKGSES